jgi:hypothetical protein
MQRGDARSVSLTRPSSSDRYRSSKAKSLRHRDDRNRRHSLRSLSRNEGLQALQSQPSTALMGGALSSKRWLW